MKTSRHFIHSNLDMTCQGRMKTINLVRFIQKHEISSQSKVKSFTRKLPCYTKVAEIPNYAILAMKELEVAF